MALTDNKNDNIVDISLDGIQRTRFRIIGDNDAIIELNLSDLGIVSRLEEGLNKLEAEVAEIAKLDSEDVSLSSQLKEIDQRMRDIVDYIFDYPESAVCAKYGTMYDPKDGKLTYERIIDGLTKYYADNIKSEYAKLQERIKKHTAKYTAAPTKGKKRK